MTGHAVGGDPARAVSGIRNRPPAASQVAVVPSVENAVPPVRAARRSPHRDIPEATVARLAVYLRVLGSRPAEAGAVVSSAELARLAGVNPAGLRKDLSFVGSYGVRGVGYDVGTLVDQIRLAIGATQAHRVALVGLGNLGRALAGYRGFAGRGFFIAALFDSDSAKIGRSIAGLTIRDIAELPEVCAAEDITIGVIATPESAAQQVADTLIAAGVRSILDFAPGVLVVPPEVELRRVDLALELQILAFLHSRRGGAGAVAT